MGRTNLETNTISIETSKPIRSVNRDMRGNAPVGVVDLGLGAEEFLLAGLVGVVSADLVAVFFGLKEGDQVDTRPHLFARELTVAEK